MNPIITLTSDIGTQDFLVGAIKGQLLQINPAFQIVDITHQVSPFNYPQAAYIIRNAINNFPEETFHIVLVNLFERKNEHLLCAEHQHQYLLCTDNGLINMICDGKPTEIIGLAMEKGHQKHTIHCAVEMGKAIQKIVTGATLARLGNPIDYIEKNPLRPMVGPNWMEGQIIFIDNFENVIVNISREAFEAQRKGRSFKIVFKRDEMIEKVSEHYADVQEGEKLAHFNSAGYLEISVNKGNAAGLFGLQGFSEKQQERSQFLQNRLYYQTVKVYFE
jgi:S-adenosyl-L-methionine hydrolase (adenosine-forming)